MKGHFVFNGCPVKVVVTGVGWTATVGRALSSTFKLFNHEPTTEEIRALVKKHEARYGKKVG